MCTPVNPVIIRMAHQQWQSNFPRHFGEATLYTGSTHVSCMLQPLLRQFKHTEAGYNQFTMEVLFAMCANARHRHMPQNTCTFHYANLF